MRRMLAAAALELVLIVSLSLAGAGTPAQASPGDLDPTFGGGDGIVRTDLSPAEDDGFAVTIQPDGKIVVAGEMGIGGPNPRFAIVRYGIDGSLDPSFGGGDGNVSIDFTPRDDFAYAVRIQADGKIVVAGAAAYSGPNSRFALARVTPDGSLDPTFGGDGTVIDRRHALLRLGERDGVAAERQDRPGRERERGQRQREDRGAPLPLRRLARSHVRRRRDRARRPHATYDDGLAVGIEADGQIVVAGGAGFAGPNERFVALAFGPHGSLDPTFGGDGEVFTDLTPKADVPFGFAIQNDGQIVVAGGAALGRADPKFALVRYERDGSLDPSLKGDGTVITNFTPYDDGAYSVAIDPDGRIVAAGLAGNGGPAPRFAAVRYLADGALDPSSAATARSARTSRRTSTRLGGSRCRPTGRSSAREWPAPAVRTPRSRCCGTSRR